jgi:hypothetical protein
MRQIRYVSTGGRSPNILVRAAGIIVGLIALGFSIVLGGVVLAGLIGIGLIVGLVLYARFWWLARKVRQGDYDERIVEAEYRVIEVNEPDDDVR